MEPMLKLIGTNGLLLLLIKVFTTLSVGNKRGKVFSGFNRNVNANEEDLRMKPKRKKPRTFERAANLDGEARVSGRTLG